MQKAVRNAHNILISHFNNYNLNYFGDVLLENKEPQTFAAFDLKFALSYFLKISKIKF